MYLKARAVTLGWISTVGRKAAMLHDSDGAEVLYSLLSAKERK